MVPALIGAIPASFRDPVNLATLPFGGTGRTIATRVINEGLVNAGVEALQVGQTAQARAKLGEEFGVAEAAADIGLAFVAGAAIRGGIEGAPAVARSIDAAGVRAAAPIRKKIDTVFAERDAARAFADAVPVFERTPEQQAALHVIAREVEIDEVSPFRQTYDGIDAHRQNLTRAMEAIEEGRIAPAQSIPARSLPKVGQPAQGGDFSPTARNFDMTRYLARNRVAESGGNDAAAAETSSAFGRYQFLQDTWVESYQATFGKTGESRAAILRKRGDGAVQDRVMQTFTDANIRALQRARVSVTEGTAYLAHFLGRGDAIKVMKTAPETPIGQVVSAASIKANPNVFRNIQTAADLAEWAERKMGGRVGAVPRQAGDAEILPGVDEAAARALDLDAADIAARRAALRPEDADPSVRLDDPEAGGGDDGPDLQLDPAQMDAGVNDAMRVILEDRAISLNRVGDLAQRLEVEEDAVRRALDRMVGRGELLQTAGGIYRRIARPGTSGPEDMIRFIARRGGLSPDGLNDAGRKLGTKGHDLRNSGSIDHFVPGAGPLIRPTGRSLDDIGEQLWEAGYFGPVDTTPRPTDGELITLMDDLIRTGERRFSFADNAPAEKAPLAEPATNKRFQSAPHEAAERARFNVASQRMLGRDLTDEEFLAAFDLVGAPGREVLPGRDDLDFDAAEDLAPYLSRLVNDRLDDAIEDAFLEVEDDFYVFQAEQFERQFRDIAGEGGNGRAGGEGQAADGGNAGQGQGSGEGRPGDAGQSEPSLTARLTPAERDALEAEGPGAFPPVENPRALTFDDPAGPGVQRAAENDWHDIRAAAAADPAIAARQAEEVRLRVEAPLRGENATGSAQDGTLGSPLFDAADAPKFDLEDGKGPRTAADIELDLESETKGIAALRDCLT